jgi:glutamate--cysteine ligase
MTAGDDALEALLDRPMREVARDALSALFVRGEKPREAWMLGLELELFAVDAHDLRAVPFSRLEPFLAALGERRAMKPEREITGALVGLTGDGHIMSLEPGGQVELATRPYVRIAELRDGVAEVMADLRAAAAQQGLRFLALGHHPVETRDTVPKMPKARYDLMRRYLPLRGTRGLDMMHLTGSVQCAVDFESEQNLVDKVRAAARISPFLAALVSASPFTAGRPNGQKSMRYAIWQDVDDVRSGIWPEMVDGEGLRYHRYVARALEVPAMFFRRDGAYRQPEARPFAHYVTEGFEGTTVTVRDFVDHLTSLFPEVRVKNYVELRGADCVLPDVAVAVGGFWRALLDDDAARAEAHARLAPLDHAALRALQVAVARDGLDAVSPVGPVRELARWLTELAHASLAAASPLCGDCMEPLRVIAARGRSPADEMLAAPSLEAAMAAVTV